MPKILKETVEVDVSAPHGRVQRGTVEHVPVPRSLMEAVEAVTDRRANFMRTSFFGKRSSWR